jgi:dihydropteroate synthase
MTIDELLFHWSLWAYHKGAEARFAIAARDADAEYCRACESGEPCQRHDAETAAEIAAAASAVRALRKIRGI